MNDESSTRPYRMRRRADQVDETRQRIVAATMQLHTTVGPARTTISGIAEEAGVTRLTVYRHFPDEEALFGACSRHWMRLHPPPDPARWRTIDGLVDRLEAALDELYRWYGDNRDDFFRFERDVDAMPLGHREGMRAAREAMVDAIVTRSGVRGRMRARLRAAAGHVVNFWTWWSLAVEQGLDHEEAVVVAVGFVLSVLPTDG